MWALVFVALYSDGMVMERWNQYDTQEDCIYAMREAEIGVSALNEGMLCLENPEVIGKFEFKDPVPGDGSLY